MVLTGKGNPPCWGGGRGFEPIKKCAKAVMVPAKNILTKVFADLNTPSWKASFGTTYRPCPAK